MTENKTDKNRRIPAIISIAIGTIILVISMVAFIWELGLEDQYREAAISFDRVCSMEDTDDVTAYIDVYKISHDRAIAGFGKEYCFVYDNDRFYILKSTRTEHSNICNGKKNTGYLRVTGSPVRIPEGRIQDVIDAFNITGTFPEPMDRQQFDSYFKGIALAYDYPVKKCRQIRTSAGLVGGLGGALILIGVEILIDIRKQEKEELKEVEEVKDED